MMSRARSTFVLAMALVLGAGSVDAFATETETPGATANLSLPDRHQEIILRPLFSPSRRPPESAPEASVPLDGDLVLRGVITTRDRRIAFIETGSPPKTVRLQEGAEIATYVVQNIRPDRIVLRTRDGTTTVVRLRPQSPATQTKELPVPQAALGSAEERKPLSLGPPAALGVRTKQRP